LSKYFALIAASFVLLPTFIGVKNFRYQDRDLRSLSLFLILSALTELVAIALFFYKINNFPVLHVFTLIEFGFLSFLYSEHIHKLIPRNFIFTLVIVFTVFSVVNSLFLQSLFTFNTYARGIEFLIILFYAIVHIYLLNTENSGTLLHMPMFWITLGIILYYASSFFAVLMVNLILPQMNLVWALHNVFLLLHYLFFAKALWIHPRQ
jgi:hypothetical protein